jgi:hypothetical protein
MSSGTADVGEIPVRGRGSSDDLAVDGGDAGFVDVQSPAVSARRQIVGGRFMFRLVWWL